MITVLVMPTNMANGILGFIARLSLMKNKFIAVEIRLINIAVLVEVKPFKHTLIIQLGLNSSMFGLQFFTTFYLFPTIYFSLQ